MSGNKTAYEKIREIIGEEACLDELLTIIGKKQRIITLSVIDFGKSIKEQEQETLEELLKYLK